MDRRMQGDGTTTDHADGGLTDDSILELNFVPRWARRPPDPVRFARFDDEPRRGSPKPDANRRRSSTDTRRRERTDEPGARRPERRPRRTDRAGDGGMPDTTVGKPARRYPPGGESPRQADAPPSPARSRETVSERPPLQIRFLPERKPLSDLIRRVSSTRRAYPLLDLAGLLMSREGCCFVRVDLQPDSRNRKLFQCSFCRTLTLSRETIEAHVLEQHLDAVFDVREETTDPPSGVFVCVAKCGLSGEWLGPPNHHRYTESVKRLHAERFSHMDFDDYRRRIQTSHDPADVEQWKTLASRREVFVRRDGGESMTRADALRYMQSAVLPKAVSAVRHAVLSETEAQAVRDPDIRRTIRQEWQAESRFPIHLAFALGAAFRHRGLHQFKAGRGKGVIFVTSVKPCSLDPDSAIPEIRDALRFLQAHPGCSRREMFEALRPGLDPDSGEMKALQQPLHWLAEKGHVIEFFNGTLSVPMALRR